MTTTTTATTTAAAAAKRFLFVMVEGGGNVSSQLGIARRLAARGHEVRVLGDAAIEPEARAAGCSFAPFATAPHHNMRSQKDDLVKDWQPGSPLAKLVRVAGTLMFGPAAAYARDLMTALESFPADALAIDYLLFGALIGAEKSGLPTATLMHTPYAPPTEGVPPFGLGWRPARGWLGRLRDRVVRRLMVRTFDKQGLALVNGARTGLGLPALERDRPAAAQRAHAGLDQPALRLHRGGPAARARDLHRARAGRPGVGGRVDVTLGRRRQ